MNEQFELPIVDESSNNLVNLDVSFDCNQKTSFLITKSDNRCPSSPNGTTTLDQYDISVNHDINTTTQQTTSNQDTANDTDSESDSILTKKNQRILDKHKEILSKLKQTRRKVTLKPYEPMYNRHGQQTYCVCRKPDDGDIMIQCDTCKEW